MAKRSTTIWVIVGIVAVLVLLGIVGVVAVPRIWGAQGFCDDVTGIRLELTQAMVDAEDDAEVVEAQRATAEETAPDLVDSAGDVRFPSGAGADAEEVADAWTAVGETESAEDTSAAAREFFSLDDAFQDEYCGGPPTAEELGG